MKKFLIVLMFLSLIVITPANAWYRYGYGGYYGGWGPGAAVGAMAGAAILGGVIGGAIASQPYYGGYYNGYYPRNYYYGAPVYNYPYGYYGW
jgi:hypothetical protein